MKKLVAILVVSIGSVSLASTAMGQPLVVHKPPTETTNPHPPLKHKLKVAKPPVEKTRP